MPKGRNTVARELVSRYRAVRGFSLVPRRVFNCHPLRLIQILFTQPKVTQDSCQSSLRDIFASVVWNRGKGAILRGTPDFMSSWSLPNKLTTQRAKLFDQYAIGHTGTRRSA